MHRKTTWVVVLGDFGRSPRMQYHALSLAQQAKHTVCVLAHHHSQPVPDILSNSSISLWHIPDTPSWVQAVPTRPLRLFIKAFVHFVLLSYCMLYQLPRPDTVLVQTPPAIPTLALCSFAAWCYGATVVIDWHNFGYSIMALTMSPSHVLVRIARWYEQTVGRRGHKHLCVSKAMQHFLRDQWGIQATVFYDSPPSWFRRTSVEDAHELLQRMTPELLPVPQSGHAAAAQSQQKLQPVQQESHMSRRPDPVSITQQADEQHQQEQQSTLDAQQHQQRTQQQHQDEQHSSNTGSVFTQFPVWPHEGNLFTTVVGGRCHWRANRPALVVSSTSWTVDEDFGVLLEAGILYDAEARASSGTLPNLVIVVTGKGPQKAMYERKMQQLELQHVVFRTAWLQAADYPVLLGCADLGISLHTSSSELDLPMKIVDMMGCGLSVCAARYRCIHELVKEDHTGLLFDSSKELSLQLVTLFDGFSHHQSTVLQHMQQQVQQDTERWPSAWSKIMHMFE